MQVPAVGAMGWGAGSHHWDRNLNGPKSTAIYHPSLPLEAGLQQTAGFQNRHIRQVPPVPRLSRSGDRFPVLPTLCHLPRIPSSKACCYNQLGHQWFPEPHAPSFQGLLLSPLCKNSPFPWFLWHHLHCDSSNPGPFSGSSSALDPRIWDILGPLFSLHPPFSLGDFTQFNLPKRPPASPSLSKHARCSLHWEMGLIPRSFYLVVFSCKFV